MSYTLIWRYLSLAKYVDFLKTQSLFFPKASLFTDGTEGKWVVHALRLDASQRMERLEADARQIEELLARAGDDRTALPREVNELLRSRQNNTQGVLRDVLRSASRRPPDQARGCLEDILASWREVCENNRHRIEAWISDIKIYRESTYISCWNREPSMSLAMWSLYGSGTEGVAVCSTENKLRAVIDQNTALLERHGMEGGIAEVHYIEGLQSPNEETQQRVFQILADGPEVPISAFSIKPSLFKFENEVRAIIFPTRNVFDPLTNPYPTTPGFALPVGWLDTDSEPSLTRFIDAVYIHPMLGQDSMMFQVVSELNKRFGAAAIPVVANPVKPFGI